MKATLIVVVGVLCLALAGLVVVLTAKALNGGLAHGRFEVRNGRLLKREREPVQFWLHAALMGVVGGGALVAGFTLVRMIGAVLVPG